MPTRRASSRNAGNASRLVELGILSGARHAFPKTFETKKKMKICEFTDYDMQATANAEALRRGKKGNLYLIPTPAESALLVLLCALETVNQAGLDGKKLSDITLNAVPDMGHRVPRYEVHAKVTHRLKSDVPVSLGAQ